MIWKRDSGGADKRMRVGGGESFRVIIWVFRSRRSRSRVCLENKSILSHNDFQLCVCRLQQLRQLFSGMAIYFHKGVSFQCHSRPGPQSPRDMIAVNFVVFFPRNVCTNLTPPPIFRSQLQLFVGILLTTQPEYITGIEDVSEARTNAFGAMGMFVATLGLSLFGILRTSTSAKEEMDVAEGYQLSGMNQSYGTSRYD